MTAGDVVLKRNQRMRGIGKIVKENLDSQARKRLAQQAHNPGEVLQVLGGVISYLAPIVFFKKPRINFLFRRFEVGADAVLFADKDQLACRCRVAVPEEVMHPEPEIVEIELREVIPVNCIRIEVVFFQPSSKAPPFLVFSPQVSNTEKNPGRDHGGDDINRQIAAEPAQECCCHRYAARLPNETMPTFPSAKSGGSYISKACPAHLSFHSCSACRFPSLAAENGWRRRGCQSWRRHRPGFDS